MVEKTDIELLSEYCQHNSEQAFAALVSRHVNLVYSVAMRNTGNPHQAQEITQAVFITLAKKASGLSRRTVLAGWLYHTSRLTASNFRRTEMRRAHREQESYMQNLLNEAEGGSAFGKSFTGESWLEIAPHLDVAMSALTESDRNAIVLRFFENKSLRDVGEALGVSEEATKKRVQRALERLRTYFAKRGVISTTVIIAGLISANSVQSAPVTLAAAVTTTACNSVVLGSSTTTFIKGTLTFMAWSKVHTTIVVTIALLLAAATSTIVIHKVVTEQKIAERHRRYPQVPGAIVDNSMNRVDLNGPHRQEILKLRADVWPAEKRAKQEEILSRQKVDETVDAVTIDLKPFINAKLTEGPMGTKGDNSDNLAQLPTGIHIYGGVPFDVEGAVYLRGGWLKRYKKENDYPPKAAGIRVDRRCGKIHILHGAGLVSFEHAGQVVARLVLHYSDGGQKELAIIAGENIWDWWAPLFSTGVNSLNLKTSGGTEAAWFGSNPLINRFQPDESLVLYRTTFANPRPDATLSSIDYVSSETITVPFMVGLTVE